MCKVRCLLPDYGDVLGSGGDSAAGRFFGQTAKYLASRANIGLGLGRTMACFVDCDDDSRAVCR